MLRYSYQEDRPVLTICSVLKLSLQERLQVFNHMVTNEEFYAMENVASAKLLKATWFGVAADRSGSFCQQAKTEQQLGFAPSRSEYST